jgi:L-2,4-diaminobutyrate transaminase
MPQDLPRNFPLEQIDRETLFHPMTSISDHLTKGPLIFSNARGVRISDQHGRDLIDCGAGLWCVNIGYGRTEMAEAAKTAIESLAYHHIFGGASNEPIIRLAERVLQLFHDKSGATHLSKVFFGSGGSDANDTNFKLVRYYNNLRGKRAKKKVISRLGAYHGLTYAAASLTGIAAYHKAFDLPLDDVLHVSCPHYYRFGKSGETEEAFTDRLIAEIEATIAREGADTIAAFIAEPVMGTGGVLLPPKGYFEKLQALLAKHDILFIADEVITGFGRTGHWFATGGMSLKPDIVTLAKGITSAYFPVSASVISERIWEVLREASPEYGPVMHGFTYSGHPVGGALGLVNIGIIEREGLVEQAAEVGAHLTKCLQQRVGDHPHVGEVRGIGQMHAVEYVADKAAKRFFDPKVGAHRIVAGRTLEQGILCRPLPFIEVNSFSPPLTMTRADSEEAVERFGKALDAATPDLARAAEVA